MRKNSFWKNRDHANLNIVTLINTLILLEVPVWGQFHYTVISHDCQWSSLSFSLFPPQALFSLQPLPIVPYSIFVYLFPKGEKIIISIFLNSSRNDYIAFVAFKISSPMFEGRGINSIYVNLSFLRLWYT